MADKLKISSLIIAKNEEKNIGRCIKSQLFCIDEIIVLVDSATTDRTAEIASGFEKVVCRTVEWKGYGVTKQEGLSLATNDWIFWIDADEELTPELIDEITEFKEREHHCAVYELPRRAYFLGKWIRHCGWYPGYVERLFNRQKARFSTNGVHEHLIYEGEPGRLEADLNHYTDPSIEHYYTKFNTYTSLAAADLKKAGRKTGISDLLLRPVFLFLKMYIFRRGFLDGREGFLLAVFSANYVFTKYAKHWELSRNLKGADE
ncbi:MAG: hypothetical protein FMNOHCHN_00045 [Ignavibacteriaceae bacterium]|nr:hypothetical protein [Ignavibacteriaceae bacterium]MCK6615808.1 glycosyltransferase family 2 protein [Ignavibacteriaceae bacterium]